MKYIIVTGGVVEGIGKSTVSASIGVLLQHMRVGVSCVRVSAKIGLSPNHEVYVLRDGSRVDSRFGTYERFLGIELRGENNINTARVYAEMSCSPVDDNTGMPYKQAHGFTFTVEEMIDDAAHVPLVSGEVPTVCIVELVGTCTSHENRMFLEALVKMVRNRTSVLTVHVAPLFAQNGIVSTRPLRESIDALGYNPSLVLVRTKQGFIDDTYSNLHHHLSHTKFEDLPDLETAYQTPEHLMKIGMFDLFMNKLRIDSPCYLEEWKNYVFKHSMARETIKILLLGLPGMYKSAEEALEHAATHLDKRVEIMRVDPWDFCYKFSPDGLTQPQFLSACAKLNECGGLIIPGGDVGTEGMINAIKLAKASKKPFLGICIGMMAAVTDALNMPSNEDTYPEDHESRTLSLISVDSSMRLGGYTTLLTPEAVLAKRIFHNERAVFARHKYRYGVDSSRRDALRPAGLIVAGLGEGTGQVEIVEMDTKIHPFFLGVQFHPEFDSMPTSPNPIFVEFLKSVK